MTEDQDLPSPVDALVVGTAFAEAAVAAALARSGDRVLHVDRNAYYGGSGAGFSLEKLAAWAAERAESRADDEVCVQLTAADRAALAAEGFSDVAVVPLATRDAAVVHAAPPLPTAASLLAAPATNGADADVDAAGPSTANGAGANTTAEATDAAGPSTAATTDAAAVAVAAVVRDVVAAAAAAGALAPARAMVAGAARFNIDLDARALLAAGDAVDALVCAGVAPYLDFVAVPRLLYWDGGAAAPTTVPCSKRDVFAAPDVAAADKRRLLRVMQAAQDRGEGAAAATLNERALTASRALRRPQNRLRATRAGDDAAPFAASLAADDGLAPPLARAVAYAVALADSADVPRGAGIDALGAHCRALARAPEGATAFLAPVYGAAGLAEALCRACAVRGGVYALGRAPSALVVAAAGAGGRRAVVGALFARRGRAAQLVRCARCVLGPDAAARLRPPARWVTRRIAVVDGALAAGAPRAAVVAAPDAGRAGASAVRGLCLDATARAVPEGSGLAVLHIATADAAPAAGRAALARASAALRAPRRVGELWALEASWPLATGPTALAGVVGVAVLDRGAPGLDVAADFVGASAAFAALRPGLPFLDDPPAAAVPPRPPGGDDEDDDDGLDGLDEVLAGLSGGASTRNSMAPFNNCVLMLRARHRATSAYPTRVLG